MKSFYSFFEQKRRGDLFWDCAKLFYENKINPVYFTIGLFEGWAETAEDQNIKELFIEITCDFDNLVLEANPFMHGITTRPDTQSGHRLGLKAGGLAGKGAFKAGRFLGGLKDRMGNFISGAKTAWNQWGSPDDPQGQAAQGQAAQGQAAQATTQKMATYFDQLTSMLKQAGYDNRFINALNNVRQQIIGAQEQPAATASFNQGTTGAATADASDPHAAQNAAARQTGQGVAQDAYSRFRSLEGDVQKIQQELEQARSEGDQRAVADLEAKLAQYQSNTSSAKRQMNKQAKSDVATSTAHLDWV